MEALISQVFLNIMVSVLLEINYFSVSEECLCMKHVTMSIVFSASIKRIFLIDLSTH